MKRLKMTTANKIRLFVTVVCVLLLYLGYLECPVFYQDMWKILSTGDIQLIAQIIQGYGNMAIVIAFVICVFINAAGVFPAIIFSVANGLLFGLVPGILLSWIGETVGVVISFLIMRAYFREGAEKLIKKHPFLMKVDDFSGKNGLETMIFARAIPYMPSGLITALGALSQISLKDYVIANLIGKFPSTAFEVFVGHDAVMLKQNLTRFTILVVGGTIVYIIIWQLYKKHKQKKSQEG